jgi:hypothetical protein
MNEVLRDITERKAQLVNLAASQRTNLGAIGRVWEQPFRVASQVNSFMRNPLVLAGLGLVMAKMPWRRLFKVSRFAYKGWKIMKIVQMFRRFTV